MPCLFLLVLEEAVKRRIHVILCALWVDDFFLNLPSLACDFSRGISEGSYSTPFIVLAVLFVPFAGMFLSGDSDAGIQGTGLGCNNQDQLQNFSICHPVNVHAILDFIL